MNPENSTVLTNAVVKTFVVKALGRATSRGLQGPQPGRASTEKEKTNLPGFEKSSLFPDLRLPNCRNSGPAEDGAGETGSPRQQG